MPSVAITPQAAEADSMGAQGLVTKQGAKLFGRAFYESLGSPKFILAPMVDHSEFAWRMLTRSFLTPDISKSLLAYTPMFHSRMFADTPKYRNHHFEPVRPRSASAGSSVDQIPEASPDYHLDGNPAFDRPLFVQFCSNSPEDLLDAARFVEPFCDAVDLNLGCPQGIARKGRYGAFLQEDWALIFSLIRKLHDELSVPVTAKMRILETKEKTLEYAKMIISAGASIITVHGRRREQKGHYTGLADWSVLRYLREHLPPETVIFANGNILQHGDIETCLALTGADGVMSAEGNLHDPTIFAPPPSLGQEGREYWRGKDKIGGYRMDAVMRRYMDILYRYVLGFSPPLRRPLFTLHDNERVEEDTLISEAEFAEKELQACTAGQRTKGSKADASVNLKAVQSHLFHLLRPLVSKYTDIRDQLARCRAGDMATLERILQMVEQATKEGILQHEASANDEGSPEQSLTGEDQAATFTDPALSSEAAVKRCRRPWWICQPYVRPLPKEAIEKGAITLPKDKKDEKRKADLGQTTEPQLDVDVNVSG